jgi:membrane dipeptidase
MACFLICVSPVLLGCRASPPEEAVAEEEAEPISPALLHDRALVIDAHADTPLRLMKGEDICQRSDSGHLDFPRMREGGVKAQFFSIFVYPQAVPESNFARALKIIDSLERSVKSCPDQVEIATTATVVEELHRKGKLAALIGVEGGHAIAGSLDKLRILHERGARYLTLTWSNTNEFADSSGDAGRWGGLNQLGRLVVAEMNRLGMIVDISHVSDKTFWDVMEVTRKPVIASHSSCRALHDVPRNLSDEMLRAVSRNGGVVCINFYPLFLSPSFRPKKEGTNEAHDVTLDILIDHVDHAIRVAGVDHVGLGSDFDGIDAVPVGMEDVTRMPAITEALLSRGYAPQDIEKVLGLNLLRVMREVIGQ